MTKLLSVTLIILVGFFVGGVDTLDGTTGELFVTAGTTTTGDELVVVTGTGTGIVNRRPPCGGGGGTFIRRPPPFTG